MGKAQIEELKSQCAAKSPWDPATGSVANGIEVVVMASAMSDLFTVSFVAASLVLRISVRGRARAIAARGPLGSLTKVFRPFVAKARGRLRLLSRASSRIRGPPCTDV